MSAGYCYARRVLYVDKEVMQAMWADLYDSTMKLWKSDYDPQAIIDAPAVGKVWTNDGWGVMYDVQNDHMTFVTLPMVAGDACRNVGGADLTDIGRYFSINGLSEIMR